MSRPFGAARLGSEGLGWAEQLGMGAGVRPALKQRSQEGLRVPCQHGPLSRAAQGQMGALGHSGPSVCSGLVAPEMPRLGIRPEEGQILLPKHKRPHTE